MTSYYGKSLFSYTQYLEVMACFIVEWYSTVYKITDSDIGYKMSDKKELVVKPKKKKIIKKKHKRNTINYLIQQQSDFLIELILEVIDFS